MSVRIGIVGYLNAHPLTEFLDREAYQVVSHHPSVIAGMLRRGELDVALCPVAAVLDDDAYQMLPGWCIGSEGPVTSVLLVAETPPEQWTKVVLDGVSRTSVVLARLLLTRGPLAARVPAGLEIVDGALGSGVDAARGSVASVVIGDVARALPERLGVRIDLASEWKAWTGLPFVFAVWATRPGLPQSVIDAIRAAGARGVATIADRHEGADRAYLLEALRYPLDDRALMGLRRFAALAFSAGLVSRDDVDLCPPGLTWRPRADVDPLLDRALAGERLDREELALLWREASLADLAFVADRRRQELHPRGEVAYALRATGRDLDALVAAGCSVVATTGTPKVAALRSLRARFPGVRLQGGLPGVDSLAGLGPAGLDVLHDDPMGLLHAPPRREALEAAWAVAAGEGIRAVAALTIGQGESLDDRVDSLVAIRDIQDRLGVFDGVRVGAAFGDGPAGSQANTAVDHLRAVAMARIALDNIPTLMAAPDTEGFGMSQASLRMGCDHFGWVSVDDPAQVASRVADVEHYIRVAGFVPAREGVAPRPVAAGSDRGAVC